MAKISLLFSLAFALAIGSSIFSVSAHPPSHKKTQKTLCPPTLSGLQTYPIIEISKLIKEQAKSAQGNIRFNTLFSICKGYANYLEGFKKFLGSKDVFGMVHAKFELMTKAMIAAQATVGVDKKLAVKVRKCYTDMAQGFVELPEKIFEISAKYHFKADAKISLSDRAEIDSCLIKLKGSIRIFVKVISEVSMKYSAEKKFDFDAGKSGFIGASAKKRLGFGKFIGLDGHGHVKVGAHAGGKIGGHAGGKVGAHAGGKVGAHTGGKIGGLFEGLLGFGGKVQFDAAGKANVGGGSGFSPLSHPHNKHLY